MPPNILFIRKLSQLTNISSKVDILIFYKNDVFKNILVVLKIDCCSHFRISDSSVKHWHGIEHWWSLENLYSREYLDKGGMHRPNVLYELPLSVLGRGPRTRGPRTRLLRRLPDPSLLWTVSPSKSNYLILTPYHNDCICHF